MPIALLTDRSSWLKRGPKSEFGVIRLMATEAALSAPAGVPLIASRAGSLKAMFAAVTVHNEFSAAPRVLRKMKLPVNPPLIGTLPFRRKSRLFFHDVTTWQ